MATDDRIALVTGANKGIGLETCRQLGKMGMKVIVGARDAAKGKAAADELRRREIDAHFVAIDVTDQASIEAAAKEIGAKFARLDILVNNAAVMLDREGPGRGLKGPRDVEREVLERTFETNLFGVIAVTQAMLPLLEKSKAGRIVNVTSNLGSLTEHRDPDSGVYGVTFPAYDMSKAALNMWTVGLAKALKGTKIKVNAGHPGWVKTDMGGEHAPMALEDGAKTNVMLATLPDDGPSGGYYHMGVHMRW